MSDTENIIGRYKFPRPEYMIGQIVSYWCDDMGQVGMITEQFFSEREDDDSFREWRYQLEPVDQLQRDGTVDWIREQDIAHLLKDIA